MVRMTDEVLESATFKVNAFSQSMQNRIMLSIDIIRGLPGIEIEHEQKQKGFLWEIRQHKIIVLSRSESRMCLAVLLFCMMGVIHMSNGKIVSLLKRMNDQDLDWLTEVK